jgi:acetyltransferase-like isoleucine patch superfamily enzyme
LSIGDGTYIGRNAHIVALKRIRIGKSVLMGDNVYIADNYHRFDRIDLPFKDQGLGFKSEVEIGNGTWLGENVCVISSKIGKQCIVGANSVVLNDVPDYCMVAGSPARIIKKYDHSTKSWEKIKG